MFGIIKLVFIVLLCFSRSLATTLFDLKNHVELNYYPFRVNPDKCSRSCNSIDDLSTKICVTSKTKDINVKVFDTITNKNEAKTIVKHISCDYKCKFNSATCNSDPKWNSDTCQCECKKYRKCKKNIVGVLAHLFARMSSI